MVRTRNIQFAKVAVIMFSAPLLVWGFSSGPDARSTAAPGDSSPQSCAQAGCHTGTALNAGGGNVALTFPNGLTYTPGQKIRVRVTITDSAARVYGFQATSRLASNLTRGQAGTFTVVSTAYTILCEDGSERPTSTNTCRATAPLEYVEHSRPNSANFFEFDWTPPATNLGNIMFYVSGNAANGNGSQSGDHIYTATATLSPITKPTISGVSNGASFVAGIVSDSWTTLNGKFNTTSNRTWNSATEIVNGKLPSSLDGISVKINNKDASVYYISDTQLNVQAPTDASLGPVAVTVTTADGTSDAFTANLIAEQPGFFMFPSNYVAAVRSDGVFTAKDKLFGASLTTVPAKPGDVLLLFGTGFGPTETPVPAGSVFSGASKTSRPVTITIGGIDSPVAFAGLTGAGLYQMNVTIPALVPNGDQAIIATINGQRTQIGALLTILKP